MNPIAVVFIWIGWILLGLIFALIALSLYCLLVEVIVYLLRKTPLGRRWLKPLASFQTSYRNRYNGNYECNKTDLPNHIKDLIGQLLLTWCPLKRPSDIFQTINGRTEKTKSRGHQSGDNYTPIVVNKELPNNSQHSNTNVSQGEKACQPKVNDTLRWLI